MDSRFKIHIKGCELNIIGLEEITDEYMYEDVYDTSPSIRQYKYSESVTINVVQSISSEDVYTLEHVDLIYHDGAVDQSDIILNKDGLYEVSHIILPTRKFIESAIPNDNLISSYSHIYFYDEDLGKYLVFNTVTKEYSETTLNTILEINPTEDNTIIRADKKTFCMCNLEKCLYNNLKTSLKQNWGKCNSNKQIKFNQDLLWMTIPVIKYLIEFNQYYEAQRVLETITDCTGVCNNYTKNSNYDCGCRS